MRRFLLILTLVSLVAAGCGDDDTGTTSTMATTTTASVTTAADTTAAPATTEASATTTTTEAPTTTVATGPLGVQWPAEGATALYRATTWNGEVLDVEARMESGVEWKGGVWTTFTFGIPEDGEHGLVIYLDVSETGKFTYKGNEGYTPTLPSGQVQREWYEDPLTIDLFEVLAGPVRYEAPYSLEFTEGNASAHGLWVETEVVSVSETLETPFGTVDDCFRLAMTIGGPFIGGDTTFVMDLWLHPEHLLARVNEMPVFADLELLESWG